MSCMPMHIEDPEFSTQTTGGIRRALAKFRFKITTRRECYQYRLGLKACCGRQNIIVGASQSKSALSDRLPIVAFPRLPPTTLSRVLCQRFTAELGPLLPRPSDAHECRSTQHRTSLYTIPVTRPTSSGPPRRVFQRAELQMALTHLARNAELQGQQRSDLILILLPLAMHLGQRTLLGSPRGPHSLKRMFCWQAVVTR
ncbi:hypothetical protein BDV98DRAFT_414227 [Pterulicium gracile]|uniref:Uncharacterized protein n=1 Tax=Pterulicium gracile TaxID=1884261 RepID=A0A5C3QM26_9AGAR|nr:hypothetical protein BDV98DRAFT_414227 [Pterula gracilis]